jgi:AcrR family transcriptional regulator
MPDPALPDAPSPVAAPRWQRRPEDRPDEILKAAQQVFGDMGFARAKIDDVARLAGVSKGTVYLYFDSKESLFREMVRAKVVAKLAHAEEQVRAHEGPVRDLLVTMTIDMFHRMRDEGLARISRVVQAEMVSFPELARFYFDEVILRARHLVQRLLELGVASGEFRPECLSFGARGLSSLLVHTANAQCFFHRFDPEALDDDEALAGLIDLYLHGVLSPTPVRG